MTIAHVLNSPGLRGCVESPRATGEWWAYCPSCGTNKRRLLIRTYSNESASLHCLGKCPRAYVLDLLGIGPDDLRGTDGRMPDIEPDWYRSPRRSSGPKRAQGEQ